MLLIFQFQIDKKNLVIKFQFNWFCFGVSSILMLFYCVNCRWCSFIQFTTTVASFIWPVFWWMNTARREIASVGWCTCWKPFSRTPSSCSANKDFKIIPTLSTICFDSSRVSCRGVLQTFFRVPICRPSLNVPYKPVRWITEMPTLVSCNSFLRSSTLHGSERWVYEFSGVFPAFFADDFTFFFFAGKSSDWNPREADERNSASARSSTDKDFDYCIRFLAVHLFVASRSWSTPRVHASR